MDEISYLQRRQVCDDITEDGLALAFTREHQTRLRYCHDTAAWYAWTGVIWRRDRTKLAFHWARELIRKQLMQQPVTIGDQARFSRAAVADAVERFARADRAFTATSDTWNTDPWLLGTPGGTVDLRTGKIRPSNPGDYITQTTAVAPSDTADCPLWRQFLDQTCGGDSDLIRFLQQWAGYSLTGSVREEALLFVYGDGGNGKSVWLSTMSNILGDYSRIAAMDTFTATKGDRHPTDIAAFQGARMVCASEVEQGRSWSEVRIKQLTGGERIKVRFMRKDFFDYLPQLKLTIIGNHMPDLHNIDEAVRRRFNIVPFRHKPAVVDDILEEKLRAEWPGILRWMIDGCLDWQVNKLVRPSVVLASTADYFSDQDLLGQWIEECCERTDADGLPARDTLANLTSSWRTYAKARGEEPKGSKGFSAAMVLRGCSRIKNQFGIRGRGLRGIRVRT